MDPLEARNLFPLVDHYIHMNHAGVSPMSQRAARRSGRSWMLDEPALPDGWAQDEADRARELLARLINASADSIALTRSTAHGISLLAAGLDWKAGDNVVGAVGEYPANVYPWMALASRQVEYRLAKPVDGRVRPRRFRAGGFAHKSRGAVTRGVLERLSSGPGDHRRGMRRRGIVFAVDVMQSVGALRVDVGRLPVDFCAAGGASG